MHVWQRIWWYTKLEADMTARYQVIPHNTLMRYNIHWSTHIDEYCIICMMPLTCIGQTIAMMMTSIAVSLAFPIFRQSIILFTEPQLCVADGVFHPLRKWWRTLLSTTASRSLTVITWRYSLWHSTIVILIFRGPVSVAVHDNGIFFHISQLWVADTLLQCTTSDCVCLLRAFHIVVQNFSNITLCDITGCTIVQAFCRRHHIPVVMPNIWPITKSITLKPFVTTCCTID